MNTIIYDLDNCELSERNGMYGGQAGSKEGIVFHGENWIVKYPKNTRNMVGELDSYTTSPLSEYIGSHIYDILGYDVHKTILGTRNGKLVVACRDFCEDGAELREIRTLKNIYNKELEEKVDASLSSTGSEHFVDLKELQIHMDYNPVLKTIDGLKRRFWDCVLIDGLINNNDRNNGNWGLLYKNKEYWLAPIYDNGAAFSNKMPESKVEKMMENPDNIKSSALNTITIYAIDDKSLHFRDILKLENGDLKSSVLCVVPLLRERIAAIEMFMNGIPSEVGGLSVCSNARKEFYRIGMEMRMENMLEPAYRRYTDG